MDARPTSWKALTPFVLALTAACASTPEAPERAEISQEITAAVTVTAVDAATREIELQRPDGVRFVVVAGPEVRDFDQIDVGQTVTARYRETLAARRLGKDEADTEPEVALTVGVAEAGQNPGAGIAGGVAVTVRVESVDLERHIVVFTDPGGALHAVRAERPEGRRFVAGLQHGDRVELIYGESAVLAVE